MDALQQQLPQLEEQFPELAKQVRSANPPPVVAPAALLHDAQTSCQIAFKELQQSEAVAVQLESECAEMVAQLHKKVDDLREAQELLAVARIKYDDAAKQAQLQVQKSRPIPSPAGQQQHMSEEQQHISELLSVLAPAQLEEVAKTLVQAAKQARENTQSRNLTPTNTPELRPSQEPVGNLPMEGVINEADVKEQPPLEGNLSSHAGSAGNAGAREEVPLDGATAPAPAVEAIASASIEGAVSAATAPGGGLETPPPPATPQAEGTTLFGGEADASLAPSPGGRPGALAWWIA